MALFFAKSSWSVLDDTATERADIWGFGSTVGDNVTPHYRLLGSFHVIEIFKKLAAENRGEILLIMIPPSVKYRFSKMRRRGDLLCSVRASELTMYLLTRRAPF